MSSRLAGAADRRGEARAPLVVLRARDVGVIDHSSPTGFTFTAEDVSASEGGRVHTVTVIEPSTQESGGREERDATGDHVVRQVVLAAENARHGEVTSTIGADQARVVASKAAWESIKEPLLFAIGQWWRFHDIDRRLEQLLAQARKDRVHASMPSLRTWREGRRLAAVDMEIHDLVQEISSCAGPLWDPTPYFTSDEATEAYSTLAEALDLEAMTGRIDERVEIVATTYEVIVDKLLHFKLFVWGILLEALIVALITASFLR